LQQRWRDAGALQQRRDVPALLQHTLQDVLHLLDGNSVLGHDG
jgi:hypothetical protein